MVDLEMLRRAAAGGDGADEVAITKRLLTGLIDLAAIGQTAQARDGQVFGLPADQRL